MSDSSGQMAKDAINCLRGEEPVKICVLEETR